MDVRNRKAQHCHADTAPNGPDPESPAPKKSTGKQYAIFLYGTNLHIYIHIHNSNMLEASSLC